MQTVDGYYNCCTTVQLWSVWICLSQLYRLIECGRRGEVVWSKLITDPRLVVDCRSVIFSLTETEIETEIIDLQLTETEIETEIIFKTETELKLKLILVLKLKYT